MQRGKGSKREMLQRQKIEKQSANIVQNQTQLPHDANTDTENKARSEKKNVS